MRTFVTASEFDQLDPLVTLVQLGYQVLRHSRLYQVHLDYEVLQVSVDIQEQQVSNHCQLRSSM